MSWLDLEQTSSVSLNLFTKAFNEDKHLRLNFPKDLLNVIYVYLHNKIAFYPVLQNNSCVILWDEKTITIRKNCFVYIDYTTCFLFCLFVFKLKSF